MRSSAVAVEERLDAQRVDVGCATRRRWARRPAAAAASSMGTSRRASLDVFRNSCWCPSTQRTARPMAAASGSGSVPAVAGPGVVVVPAPPGHRLDRLHGHLRLGAHREQRVDVGPVGVVLQADEAVRQQDRVEREALEAAQVHAGDARAVAGDADEAHQALVAGLRQRLDGAAGAVGRLPLVVLDEVVELDEVDGVDLQPLERSLQFGPGGVARALAGLGGEEEARSVLRPSTGRCAVRSRRTRRPCRCGSHRGRAAPRAARRPAPVTSTSGRRPRRSPGCWRGPYVRTAPARSPARRYDSVSPSTSSMRAVAASSSTPHETASSEVRM